MKICDEPQEEITRVAFEASREVLPEDFTFDDMRKQLGHWRLRGIFDNDKCVGAIMDNEGIVHISVLPEARRQWASRNLLKQAIHGAMIDGKVSTFVFNGDRERAKFAERLGFIRKTENDEVARYDYVIH